ncbi:hypothetical protein [Aureimonas populi]|uniref:Uncharacterized protein n=1 Tax=Aureimonas populi TaxID=1701758 RepID=A0ABW5CN17_9HYPH|nr:hypothetical protein [Aureimonas populi]
MMSEKNIQIGRASQDPLAASMAALELELALDFQHADRSFREGVQWAAASIGGEVLFEMPAEGQIEDASRICGVRIPAASGHSRPTILFALLDEKTGQVRVADRRDVGERLYSFATAYASLMDRLKRRAPATGEMA